MRRFFQALLCVLLLLLLWMPSALLVVSSLHTGQNPRVSFSGMTLAEWQKAKDNVAIRQEIAYSAAAAMAVGILCSTGGMFAGYRLRKQASLDRLAVAVAFLPLLMPPHAVAWAFAWLFQLIGIPRGFLAVVFGHLLLYFPIALLFHAIRAVQLGDRPEVAQNLGASFSTLMRQLIWPHQRPTFSAAFAVVAALSLSESTTAYYLSGTLKPFSAAVAQGLGGAFDAERYSAAVALFMVTTALLMFGLSIQWYLARRVVSQ